MKTRRRKGTPRLRRVKRHRVWEGDCAELLRRLPDASADSVVTDPPYGLSFMARDWDGRLPNVKVWEQCLRVLRPGGHLVAFGGSRTFHRLACHIEDAGFEIRDCLSWLYGTGFPKSMDVSKAIDAAAGAEREVVGRYQPPSGTEWNLRNDRARSEIGPTGHSDRAASLDRTAPATEAAKQWQGWGTALKPAWEPIILARKPLSGTVAATVTEHGTGALNVDGCRIAASAEDVEAARVPQPSLNSETGNVYGYQTGVGRNGETFDMSAGRYPANVVLDEWLDPVLRMRPCAPGAVREFYACYEGVRGVRVQQRGEDAAAGERQAAIEVAESDVPGCWLKHFEPTGWAVRRGSARLLDEHTGTLTSGALTAEHQRNGGFAGAVSCYGSADRGGSNEYAPDKGGASRFFYVAKAAKREREAGLPSRDDGKRANRHPTVKPIALMRWLCRLVTPPGGLVVDPFCGSGSTGCAAASEGFRFLGMDSDPESVQVARLRVAHWAAG